MGIKLASDTIGKDDLNALAKWLLSNPKLTKGELTKEFEEKFAKAVGAKYAVFVNSGSSANLVALYATKLLSTTPIKAVGVSSLSWATDVAPIIQLGMKPVYIDCDRATLGICTADLWKKYKKDKFQALMSVSVLGLPPNMTGIVDFCQSENIALIEDNCESLHSELAGRQLGTFGDMATWSTYYGHHISTIEGGVVTTDDVATHELLLQLRSHGWARDLSDESQKKLMSKYEVGEFDAQYKFYVPGFNVRNTEVGAFLGLRQLDNSLLFAQKRYKNWCNYVHTLDGHLGWIPAKNTANFISNFAFPVIHKARKIIAKNLQAADIECRPLIAGSMTKQPMCYEFSETQACPLAEYVSDYGMYVPNHQDLTETDINKITTIIIDSIGQYEHRNSS